VTHDATLDHPAGTLPATLKVRLWESVLGALPRIILALCGGVALLLVAYQAPVALAVPAGLLVRRAAARQLGRAADAPTGDEGAGRKG
jgi:hypothetical protein